MNKKRGLGRGLGALLGEMTDPLGESVDSSGAELRELPLDALERGIYQPRSHMRADNLQELADSIRAQGVMQPIVVRPRSGGGYEIIAGERRWRAARLAGLATIPAVVRDVPDHGAVVMALIENIQREDLNALDQALALQRLIDEFAMTHQSAAAAVGRSRAAVSNLLRLLELNDDVKTLIENGQLDMGHARTLLALSGTKQSLAARDVVARKLSVRETEHLVKRLLQDRAETPAAVIDADVRRLQDGLSERLGAKVSILHGAKGRGKLLIEYRTLEQLDGILERIK